MYKLHISVSLFFFSFPSVFIRPYLTKHIMVYRLLILIGLETFDKIQYHALTCNGTWKRVILLDDG